MNDRQGFPKISLIPKIKKHSLATLDENEVN